MRPSGKDFFSSFFGLYSLTIFFSSHSVEIAMEEV